MTETSILKSVGRVKDAHGLRGEVFIRLFAGRADWLNAFNSAYLVSPDAAEVHGIEVEHAKPHKDGLIVKIKDVEDRTPAESLRGYELEIPVDYLVSAPGERIFLHEIMGFNLLDLTTGIETVIEGVTSNGPQDLLIVKVGGDERLVPLVKDFIEKIDFAERTLHMRLPLGLLNEI